VCFVFLRILFFLTAKNKMNKKEHLRGALILLQNEKTKEDYKAISLYRKTKTKKGKTSSGNTKKPTY